ncbi:MAG: hypothetical protein LBR77_10015 [Lachnospiraceae bacterium]|jgi:hypothetical protein|nr:hypothetical protein [Lachnospiraceae bacterium]
MAFTYHSRAYHKYFEDYAERAVTAPDGKVMIERVYVGNYYRQSLTAPQRIRRKIMYAVLYALAAFGMFFAGTRDNAVNAMPVGGVPSVLSLLAVIWLAVPMFYALTAPTEMTVRIRRLSGEQLMRRSLATCCVMGAAAMAVASGIWWIPGTPATPLLLCSALYLVSGLAAFCIWKLEKSCPYETLPPRHERAEFATVIKYEGNF